MVSKKEKKFKGYNYLPDDAKIITRIKWVINYKGFIYLLKKTFYKYLFRLYHKIFFRKKTFIYNNKKFIYFHNSYNNTFANERSIEIPIFMDYISKNKMKKILEIGNVLSNYTNIFWDVIDKYDLKKNVINQDIENYKPRYKYDCIISISTFEHIGYDESLKDPNKILKVIQNIKKNCLKKGGKLLISVPMNYNKYLDNFIINDNLKFDSIKCFKRLSWNNKWIEASLRDIQNDFFDKWLGASGIVILSFNN